MSQSLNIRLVSLVLLVGLSMFLFSQASSAAIHMVVQGENVLPSHTVLASIDVSNLTKEEAVELLEAKTSSWKENNPVVLMFEEESLILDKSFIQFDVEGSIQRILDGEEAEMEVSVDQSYFKDINNELKSEIASEFLFDQFASAVTEDAKPLPEQALEYNGYHFVDQSSEALNKAVSEYNIDIPTDTDVSRVVQIVNGVTLDPEATLSYNSLFIPESVYDETSLNVVSSALYASALKAGFIAQERHISHRPPSYVELGLEAQVDLEQGHDLKLFNPFISTYTISLEVSGQTLTAKIVGLPTISDFNVNISDVEDISPNTIIHYSSFVTPGSYNLVQQGKKGRVVTVTRMDERLEDSFSEFVSEDYYPPINRIEEHYDNPDGTSNGSDSENLVDDGQNSDSSGTQQEGEDGSGGSDSEQNQEDSPEDDGSSDTKDDKGDVWERDPDQDKK
ncbi:VanW family protein [Halobacillus yeomjeoni]|uniref:VanW family protein n=1 Tax=Halobacillus yeomjeoni TaxID=311194 RepID=A0A931HUK6_9BACI|nr:VanW family protein [Halobacillus yeomjeoni]MBH0230030.1 VanW family protein [Halobacillus yeomjeoni]